MIKLLEPIHSMNAKLTPSQQKAYARLDFFFRIGLKRIRPFQGIKPRPFPLLVGPSGCGKTFLVSTLASEYDLSFFSVNINNWIVRGAKADLKPTMSQIAEYVQSNDRGVIFIDEVNKLKKSHTGESAWTADIFTEVIALLDRDGRLENMGFEGALEKLQKNFIIVGAAAFHEEWMDSLRSGALIGFAPCEVSEKDQEAKFTKIIQKQESVPEELLNRFNDRLIVIMPPTKEEYAGRITSIRNYYELPPLFPDELNQLADEAVESGKMMRWLEGYVTDCLDRVPKDRLDALANEEGDVSCATSAKNVDGAGTAVSGSGKSSASTTLSKEAWTTMRDGCWDDFANALKLLSSASRRLGLLLEGVLISNGEGMDLEKSGEILEFIKKLNSIGSPTSFGEDDFNSRVVPLDFIADTALLICHRYSSDDKQRGMRARDVETTSLAICNLLPTLISLCGSGEYAKQISLAAQEFATNYERAHFHRQELTDFGNTYPG